MIKKNKKFLGVYILLAQIFLFFVFSKTEKLIIFHQNFFEILRPFHQVLFSWIPFSIGDVLYVFLLILFIIIIFFSKEKWKNILYMVNVLYFLYQILWGLLYFQKPIKEKFSSDYFTLEEVEKVTIKYLHLSKRARENVLENAKGVFTINNLKDVEWAILKGQELLPKSLITNGATKFTSFKPSLFSKLMNFTGVLGYYNPFSGEAQYNAYLPHTYLPFTISHESAHQLGIAREQEAHFIAYLLGKNSKNKDLQYSTYWFVLKSLLNFQKITNPQFVEKIKVNFSEGMKRDFAAEKIFYTRNNDLLSGIFSFTNDWFLKFNQQEGNIDYTYFVNLLILYEKQIMNI